LSNLQLPDFSIQNITSGSFELKSGIGGQFFDANKRAALIGQYGLFEANRIIQKVLEQLYTQ
jgi:hypothetical protein